MGYAGFWRRGAALLIDSLLVTAAFWAVFHVMTSMGWDFRPSLNLVTDDQGIYRRIETMDWSPIWMEYAIGFPIDWLYTSIMLSSPLQATVGKIIMNIYVTDLGGKRIGFGRATLRYIASIASFLVLFLGYFIMLVSGRRQTLHDMVAGTLVVHEFAPSADIR